jgi:hypothetical protein
MQREAPTRDNGKLVHFGKLNSNHFTNPKVKIIDANELYKSARPTVLTVGYLALPNMDKINPRFSVILKTKSIFSKLSSNFNLTITKK